ncbi:MAG: class I SAM-dependent methyltransferase [Firmicutes bacterium]|jgi:SAM-dependent methyltransferase|nr:class I SAM-dependent methyltransferase [Bacillota bacterium]MCL5013098.1 class I SAM-dependent methyltransferase [Bacillota bacterium]
MSLSGYDAFSWLYQRYWDDYTDIVWPLIQSSVLPQIGSGSRVLDLCCGTGKMAAKLSGQGFQVTGIDNSKEMIKIARIHAPEATLLCQDARRIHMEHRVQAVFSLFDSLNHMPTLDDLATVFEQVWSVLNPGGLFFFDMNGVEKYESRWPGRDAIICRDHVAAISTQYDLKTRVATFNAAVFRFVEGQWIRDDVHLTQTAYSTGEIRQALEHTGFQPVRILNGSQGRSPASFYGRLFFWAHKPESA